MVSFLGVRNPFKWFRSLSEKEKHELKLLSEFLGPGELKLVGSLLKQKKVSIIKKKLEISFLISGSTLLPSIVSETEDVSDLNEKIIKRHRVALFEDFSQRAFGVIPQFMAPMTVGFVEEKQALACALFSQLRIVLTGDAKVLVDSFNKVRQNEDSVVRFLDKYERDVKLVKDANFVFFSKVPNSFSFEDIVDKVIVDNETPFNDEDFNFIRAYVLKVRGISAKLPRHLSKYIRSFVKKVQAGKHEIAIGESFVYGVVELAKASARMEMRNFVTNKDLDRAFRIAEKANK